MHVDSESQFQNHCQINSLTIIKLEWSERNKAK